MNNRNKRQTEAIDQSILTETAAMKISDNNQKESTEKSMVPVNTKLDKETKSQDDAIESVLSLLVPVNQPPNNQQEQENTFIPSMKRQHCGSDMKWCPCQSKKKAQAREDKISTWKQSQLSECINRINNDWRGRISSTSISTAEVHIWKRPEPGWIKLNTFGWSRRASGLDETKMSIPDNPVTDKAVCGGVIRNSNGEVILSFVKQLGKVPKYTAKCLGVHHGVLEIYSLPFEVKRVWIECDCMKLATLVHLNSKEGTPVHELLQEFEDWHVSCISDDGNMLAQGMAVLGSSVGEDISIRNDVFPPLRWMVEYDIKREVVRF